MAARIFNKAPEEVTKLDRYLGKTTVHAAQREQSGKGLSERLAKDGYFYDQKECDGFIKGYKKAVPGLEDYFRWVRGRIISDRQLMTDWGRILRFDYDRLDNSVYRAGYSFDPQANVADHMNQKGLVPFHWWLADNKCGRINVHAHDALFFSVKPERAFEATKALVESLESPYVYHGTSLVMPCGIKVGMSWKGAQEWKRLPTQSIFEEVVYEVVEKSSGRD